MPEHLEIKKAAIKDCKQIHDLYKSVLNEYRNAWTVNTIQSIENLKKIISDKSTLSFVAEINKKVVGIAVLRRQQGKRSHVAEIGYDVRKEYRNQGIATLLINRILKEAKKNQIKSVIAWTASDNKPSIKMMKKSGFKEAGGIKDGVLRDGKYYDYALFQKNNIS